MKQLRIAALAGIFFVFSGESLAQPRTVSAVSFGAVADGRTDNAGPIQRAIDAVAETGGTVVIPAADRPYMLRDGLRVTSDNVTLSGAGATLRLADGAIAGEIVDVIEVRGTADDPVEGVVISGLTIDANYWTQHGSYNPRGIDSDHAFNLLVENVTIDRAFVGLTFGLGVRDSTARAVRITRWYDDAFNASGDGFSGGASGIRFVRCVAEDSPDEGQGGLPGNRNNAWEIEDGTHDVELIDCVVRNAGGNGFGVRNHGWDRPVVTSDTRLIRCRAENVARLGFHVRGQRYPNTLDGVLIRDCTSDSVSVFEKDVRGLRIENSRFTATVTIGPARDALIEGTAFDRVRLWSQPVGGPTDPGGYFSSYTFTDCTFAVPPSVWGPAGFVTFDPEP